MAEGQLCWEDRSLTSAEKRKLAIARKPNLSSSIVVAYPHLNQGEWVSPLVHSQHKNLSESDSENEAADFPRFIVIESLEEVRLAKFSSFLIEKVILTKGYSKNCKESQERKLASLCGQPDQAESILKM